VQDQTPIFHALYLDVVPVVVLRILNGDFFFHLSSWLVAISSVEGSNQILKINREIPIIETSWLGKQTTNIVFAHFS
jgi:hypothetical protein